MTTPQAPLPLDPPAPLSEFVPTQFLWNSVTSASWNAAITRMVELYNQEHVPGAKEPK